MVISRRQQRVAEHSRGQMEGGGKRAEEARAEDVKSTGRTSSKQ